MGHCTSMNSNHRGNGFSSVDVRVQLEYQMIKGKLSDNEINEKCPEYRNIAEKVKENLKSSKKISRFMKWHKMAYTETHRKYLKQENFATIAKLKISEHNVAESEGHYNGKNLEPVTPFRTRKLTHDIKFPLKKISTNSLSSDSSKGSKILFSTDNKQYSNSAERGLRSYFSINQHHFIERVAKGPPSAFRWTAWLITSGAPEVRNVELYSNLLEIELDQETETQISKDISRTLRESNLEISDIQSKLYKLLRAFANLDKELSYCQGMNFIVGFFLIVSDFNELDTLYLLISVFSTTYNKNHTPIRGLFSKGFPLLMFYLHAFDHFFKLKLPKLHQHFSFLELPSQIWIGKWFQTLFTHCLTFEALMRLWDNIFSSGLEFMISFSLSLLNFLQNKLLSLTELADVTEFFKKLNAYHYKLNPEAQIEYNVEDLIKRAKKKFHVSKDEVNHLKYEFYNIHQNMNVFTNESEKVPYEVNDVAYNVIEFLTGRFKSNKNEEKLKKISEHDDSEMQFKCGTGIPRNKSSTNNTIFSKFNNTVDKSEGFIIKRSDILDKVENIIDDSSDDGVFSDMGILEENKKVLELLNTNPFKLVNPFLKKTLQSDNQNELIFEHGNKA